MIQIIILLIARVKVFFYNIYFSGKSNSDIFREIYISKLWGVSSSLENKYYSGNGSHKSQVIVPYIHSTISFIKSLNEKLVILDIGCGDFNIGSQLVPYSDRYIACDIVPELIDWNKNYYADLKVDFRVLNVIEDPLPKADILILRQVLQHLSNADICKALKNISQKYRFLLVTEHVPSFSFDSNKDIKTGPEIRLFKNSGVVLTAPPFNLVFTKSVEICRVSETGGVLITMLYEI